MRRHLIALFAVLVLIAMPVTEAASAALDDCEAGDVAACTRIIESSSASKVQRASAYYYRGSIALAADDNAVAFDDFTDAVAIVPDFWEAQSALGQAAYRLGRHGRAVDALTKAISLKDDLAELYRFRAWARHAQSNWGPALEDYTSAIRVGPAVTGDYYNRGNVHRNLGDHRAAVEDYTSALERRPNDLRALNNRGIAYLNLGELDLAIADYDAALAIDPGFEVARGNRQLALDAKAKEAADESRTQVSDNAASEPAAGDASRDALYVVEVTECDRLASHPDDPDSVIPADEAVSSEDLKQNAAAAREVCADQLSLAGSARDDRRDDLEDFLDRVRSRVNDVDADEAALKAKMNEAELEELQRLDAEFALAQFTYTHYMYLFGRTRVASGEEVYEFYLIAADVPGSGFGYAHAAMEVAFAHEHGRYGFSKSIVQAESYFRHAADLGHPDGASHAARLAQQFD